MIKARGTGFKKYALWLVTFSVIGVTSYPIIIKPLLDSSEYKEIQKITRQGVDQEKIQPGNMRVWRDPFKK